MGSSYNLDELVRQFSVPVRQYQFMPVNDGLVNDTFLVQFKNEPKYILQRINHHVFRRPMEVMANIDKALKKLVDMNYEQIELIGAHCADNCFKHRDNYWRLMAYIPDSGTFNITKDPKVAFEAGRIVGKFHYLMKDERVSEYAEVLSGFHNLDLRVKQFTTAQKNAGIKRFKKASAAIENAKTLIEEVKGWNDSSIPLRICHNDTKLNNILFSKKDGKALCLIDLDTIMKGYFYNDFGDLVRTVVNTAPEDERNLDNITFDMDLFKAVLNGISKSGLQLNQAEIESLYLGTLFMPMIHGLRALTDYLENDKYYKVNYENQNLDRCLSLFCFASIAKSHRKELESLIRNFLVQ